MTYVVIICMKGTLHITDALNPKQRDHLTNFHKYDTGRCFNNSTIKKQWGE